MQHPAHPLLTVHGGPECGPARGPEDGPIRGPEDGPIRGPVGVVARRGLPVAAATRPFTLYELARALHDPPTRTVYVETDAAGTLVGANGAGAASVAAACRVAPHAGAAAAVLCGAGAALQLRLVAGVAPHHDVTLWPPPLLALAAPRLPPPDLTPAPLSGEAARGGGHECPYCGRRYSRRYGLRIHVRTHTGARPLRCAACGRAFADPSNLNKHLRLHRRRDRASPRTRTLEGSADNETR